MNMLVHFAGNCKKNKLLLFTALSFLCLGICNAQAPANDNCASAINIPIPSSGYGLGTFTSLPANLTAATVQAGETYAPAIFVAALDKKSVWYKFSIPTIRAVRVTLTQPGTTITAGDAGFAVYQTSNCLPTNANISTKLTPIVTFGNTYHPCVPSGDYLLQVSANLNANGPVTIQLEISDQTGAAYDHPNQAYAFGTAGFYARKIDFNTECQSIEDASEICNAFADPTQYNKSAWLTFKTPSYFDYIVLQLSGTGVSSYFPSNNNQPTKRTFGFRLYKGNAVTTPINSLLSLGNCDSLQSDGYYAGYRMYKCSDLDTGTIYSIQIFIKKDFADDIRIGILTGGQGPTKAPKPILANVPTPNAIGVLPFSAAGIVTGIDDVWGCNSRHNTTVCNPALPDTGIVYNGAKYNLSSFVTFTLSNTCGIYFDAYATQCGPQPLVRIFKQGLSNSCSGLDTANIIGTFSRNGFIDCLAPGNYTVQVSGQEYTYPFNYFNYVTATGNYEQCFSSNLGTSFRLNITAYYRKVANKYSLNVAGAFDSINRVGSVMQPLADRVAYSSVSDTIGCQPTLRPVDTTCSPVNDKVIYRQFVVNDSGVVDFSNLTFSAYSPMRYRLYKGDANALATAQNIFAFPNKITGLKPITECMDWNTNCTNKEACVIPGTYTFTSMAGDADVGRADKPVFTFVRTRTKHNSPFTAQNLGSLWDTLGVGGGSITTDVDDWSCNDNAVAINGTQPCIVGGKPATKAIYRQFYLNKTSLVRIENIYYYYCYGKAYGFKSLFYGKATDGFSGLTAVGGQWSCFQNAAGATAGCDLLPPGWYTVVSYNQGPSYDSTFRSLNLEGRYNSAVGYNDEFKISVTPSCPGPLYNRPYKASVATGNAPHSILLVNRVNSTPAYPRTDTTYILPKENFNCTLDTPFANHPIKTCEPAANRVVYYVFKTTRECFLQINTGGYFATVYNKDVRADSLQFATLNPIQTCNNTAGYIQFCYFQPGTYTLVIFAKDANVCQSVTPSIYIDVTNIFSRFDYAKNAYDFGVVPPDSVWHYGKVGDINPLNSGRAPGNDIFYCTTGASSTDPAEPVCYTSINPNVYNSGPNKPLYDSAFAANIYGATRRNIWYTFLINQPGYVKVKVESKTLAREYQQKFSVYRSNVDGTLPFSNVVSTGQVDSTAALGLTHIGTNQQTWYYCANLTKEVQFYRDPCSSIPTRYYVLVENVNAEPFEPGGTLPNTQTEVSVLIDSVNLIPPKHDHYSLAGNIGTVGVGTFTGDIDNYSCATKDATDPIYYYGNSAQCQKTLWYKFTSTITGNVRFRIYINGVRKHDYYDVQLFKPIIAGDSTVNGLQIQGYAAAYDTDGTYWAECCVAPGTYYLLLPGCDQVNAFVYPEIQLIEAVGDFCSRAIPAVLNGTGTVTASVLVNCHTIGTDYGEFGPQLTCPQGAATADYKSSWFKMDIGGTDTLDVTTYLVENTNAASSDIKYRLMTGNCGAMQEQSCVLDALTQNTYQCLVPGQSYFVQVFTPITKFGQAVTGTIDLKLSAIKHADTCAALANCLANANFTSLFNCTTDDSVKFVNFSTYGTSISYKWNFGYNGQTSNAVSPSFFYPALATDQSYSVKLLVENISCGKKDSVTRTVTVPGRPFINFGNDIPRCDGSPITLKATSHTGATYTWQNGTTADTLRASVPGNNEYWVKIDYNGCSNRDTVKVVISPIAAKPLQQIILCTDSVSINASSGQGETYRWNTGAVTAAVFASKPGVYWVDINYFTCTYRDSFVVNNVATARPLGNDTNACLSNAGHVLNARTAGAVSYTWQDGSTADTFKVTNAGQYAVSINFGNCLVKDTVNITGFPAPITYSLDTSICFGSSFTLPWGKVVTTAGVYRDTVRFAAGCDSLIQKVTLGIYPKPNIGSDTTVCLVTAFPLNGTTTGAVSYTWQNGSTAATFNALSPGLYWVSVNFGTCSTKDSITISGSPAPGLDNTDTSICFGNTLTLLWGRVVNSSGVYRDTIRTYSGCDSIIRKVTLTVQPKPALGIDTTVSICGNNSFNLTTAYPITGLTTNWTLANITVANPVAVNAPGIYQLIAANSNGCADTALLTLSISPKPNLGNDSAVSICEGNIYNLTLLHSTTGLTTNWTKNGVAVTTPSAVNIAGTYQLIAANNSGCTDTALVNVTINAKQNLGNDSSINICSGTTVNLTTIYNTTSLTAVWKYNNAVVANPSSVTANGVYQLMAIAAASCADTALVTITYNAKPNLGNDTAINICSGTSFNLTTVYNTASLSSNWTLNSVAVANPATVSAIGNYQIIATNSSACADTAIVIITFHPKPNLGNDTALSICQGNAYNLSTLYNSTGLVTNWTKAGIAVTTPSVVNIAGVYQLIASNAVGCKDTAMVTLSINTKPFIGNDTSLTICEGNTANLTPLYNTAGLTSGWTKNNIAIPNPTAESIAGQYQLIAATAQGCRDTVIATLIVNPKPALGNDKDATICEDKTYNLTTAFATGSNTNQWTKNAVVVSSPAAVNIPGVYQLFSTNSFGCADTALVTLAIVSNPLLITNNPALLCSPQTVDLTAPAITAGSASGLVFSYWKDTAATTLYANATAAIGGQYFIKATNAAGCFAIKSVSVLYYPLPLVNAGADIAICDKDSTSLSATVTNSTAPVTFQWEPAGTGGISNPTAATTMVKPAATRQYIVTVKDGYGCNYLVSDSVLVTMQPPVIAFAGNDTNAVRGLPHQMMATGGVNYTWTPGSFLDNRYSQNPLATIFTESIKYAVVVKDAAGCIGYDTVLIRVYDDIRYYVPNAFSPNGDGVNEVFRPIAVGVVSTEFFRIFNRYGELVFETNQWMKGWDGKYRGVPQGVGNFIWVIKGKGSNGKVIEMKGNVLLVK